MVRAALVPPLDVSQFPSPLPGFRRYTEPNTAALYDKVVLKVGGLPSGALVRFATLDAYDGLVWGAADRSTDGVPFQQVGSRIAPRGDGTPVDVSVEVEDGGYGGNWLPTVGAPTRVEFDGPRADELSSELWLNPDTDTAVVPGGLLGGERYTMSALLPPTAPTELPEDLDVAGGASSTQDLDVLDARIDAWSSRAEGSWGKLRAVATQMRTEGTYTDGGTPNSFEKVYLPGHATARLSRFVNSTKLAGNDEQYAATLALVGQRLGIPSRVVMGAEPEAGGEVRGRDVHAWVEVRLDDGSWYPLRAETFVPSRDKTPERAAAEVRGAEGRCPGAAARRGQPALAAPGSRPGAERHRHPQAQEVAVRRGGLAVVAQAARARHRAAAAAPGRLPAARAVAARPASAPARDHGAGAGSGRPGLARPRRRGPLARGAGAAPRHSAGAGARARRRAGGQAGCRRTCGRRRHGIRRVGRPPRWMPWCSAWVTVTPTSCSPCTREAESVLAELRAGTGRWTRWRADADPRPLLARTQRPGESRGPWWRRLRVPGIRRRGDADPTPA